MLSEGFGIVKIALELSVFRFNHYYSMVPLYEIATFLFFRYMVSIFECDLTVSSALGR